MRKSASARLLASAVCAVAMVGAGASAASAGEITGNGKRITVKGASICAFSGQNDEFQEGDRSAPRVQSFGQIVKAFGPMRGVPGVACNPTRG